MLVLGRYRNEAICIGVDIEIYVVDVTPTQARIGVRAPDRLQIRRCELIGTSWRIGEPIDRDGGFVEMVHADLRLNQGVQIGKDIIVILADIRGGPKARLGIEAPQSIQVYRKEVFRRIRQEGPRAARSKLVGVPQ